MSTRSLMPCVAAAIALHGAVLAWASLRPEDHASGGGGAQGVVQVRLQSLAVKPVPSPAMAADEAVVDAPTTPVPAQARAAVATNQPGSSDQAHDPSSSESGRIDLNGYVPRRWLTVAPEPVAPIVLPYPVAFQDRTRYKVILNLYIELDGRVSRVEFEGVPLPDLLQHAARSTFENALFTAGQVKGQTVKSLIQIEVDFDGLGAG